MKKNIMIPLVAFYFVRHGETDWNRLSDELCGQDDIPLNEVGLLQAIKVSKQLTSLNITKICSSPLERAKQTAEIIKNHLGEVDLEFHPGLGKVSTEVVAKTFEELLNPSHTLLVVSHGEVYRILLRILGAQADPKAKNCGLYFFNPPTSESNYWTVRELDEEFA